ncbi:MAG: hypothetical protein RL607_1268 [Bacteroidota bacterium]|jgi:cell wall-associated NlpC family hydrolase
MSKLFGCIALLLVLVSCKSTQSPIITTKKEAIKQKKYTTYTPQKNTNTTASTSAKEAKPKKVKTVSIPKEPEVATSTEPQKQRVILDQNEDDIVLTADDATYFSEQLVNNAMNYLGTPYRGGGTSRDGFDCSGLMFTTFQAFDIILPRSSHEMARIGRVLDRNEIRRGDLIFFRTNGRRTINHVGMVTEVTEDEIKFVHSSTQQGVVVSSTKEPYYQRTFAQVNRVIE